MSALLAKSMAALLCIALVGRIAAQEPSRDRSKATDIPEIIVTAEKVSENLQRVPLAVTAVGAQQLEDFHVTQLTDVGGYIPGLAVNSGGTPGQTSVSIRGIGGLDNSATASMYLDETPIGPTSPHQRSGVYMLDILPYDIEHIEVLAGPQGTLYGANAFGGVVKYALTTPSLQRTDVRIGADGFSVASAHRPGYGVRSMINTPIVADKLGFLASYARVQTPGFVDNANSGQRDQNKMTQQSARIAILGQPTDNLKIRLSALYSSIRSDGNGQIALDNSDHPRPLFGVLTDNNFAPNLYEDRMNYESLDINWDMGWASLVSATSYTNDRSVTDIDSTATYFGLANLVYNAVTGDVLDPATTVVKFPLHLKNKKFTQELRLNSKVGNLDWMLGGYYDDEKGENLQTLPVTTTGGASVPIVDPLFNGSFPTTYEEYAVFGNADYHFTPDFDVAIGVRYAKNKQSFRYTIVPVTFDIIPPNDVLGHSQEGVTTYNFTPRYQLTANQMVYGRVATGYQAGGPNIAIFGAVPQIDAARITTFEAGWKASFPEVHAQLNLAVYDNEWKKIQVAATAPGGVGITLNAGKARSRGFTADGSIRPTAGVTLSANVAFTDAKLADDSAHAPGGPGGFKGDRLPQQPRWAGSIRADYSWALSADWQGRVGGGLRMTGRRWMSGTELVAETIDGTTLNPGENRLDKYELAGYAALDLNAGISNERYKIGLYVKNANNKKAILTAVDVPDGLSNVPVQREGIVMRPRTVGISFDATF